MVEPTIDMANILYISLTGMTEALGESQVVQYLVDLAKDNKIYLLSFEKPTEETKYTQMRNKLSSANIKWEYLIYSNKYGVLSTILQIISAYKHLKKIVRENNIHVIHTRSLIPAVIGMLLKSTNQAKLLFDIRGFAIDEKIVDGRLKENSILAKILKKIEAITYKKSDHIVTLTHASKPIINDKYNVDNQKISVIPTCANEGLFKPYSQSMKTELRRKNGYTVEDIIFIHSGSLNNWVDFEAEIKLFEELQKLDMNARFLIINKGQHDLIKNYLKNSSLDPERVKITSANFNEMNDYLNIADVCVFFIKPSFAKKASAPTKFAELVSCQLISITNKNYGDMDFYLNNYKVGMLVDLDKVHHEAKILAESVLSYVKESKNSIGYNASDFISCFKNHFSKDLAVQRYQTIYDQLCEDAL